MKKKWKREYIWTFVKTDKLLLSNKLVFFALFIYGGSWYKRLNSMHYCLRQLTSFFWCEQNFYSLHKKSLLCYFFDQLKSRSCTMNQEQYANNSSM